MLIEGVDVLHGEYHNISDGISIILDQIESTRKERSEYINKNWSIKIVQLEYIRIDQLKYIYQNRSIRL